MKFPNDLKNKKKIVTIGGCLLVAAVIGVAVEQHNLHTVKPVPMYTSSKGEVIPVTPPSVITQPATGVTATGATINAVLSSTGGATTNPGFIYEGAPIDSSPMDSAGNYSVQITKLTCGNTYSFNATASNSVGKVDGATRVFTTTACTPVKTSAKKGK